MFVRVFKVVFKTCIKRKIYIVYFKNVQCLLKKFYVYTKHCIVCTKKFSSGLRKETTKNQQRKENRKGEVPKQDKKKKVRK